MTPLGSALAESPCPKGAKKRLLPRLRPFPTAPRAPRPLPPTPHSIRGAERGERGNKGRQTASALGPSRRHAWLTSPRHRPRTGGAPGRPSGKDMCSPYRDGDISFTLDLQDA